MKATKLIVLHCARLRLQDASASAPCTFTKDKDDVIPVSSLL
jgi:hypothetical protein